MRYSKGKHVYDKGGLMVNTMRQTMGDTEFKKACHTFIKENELKNVNTSLFINTFTSNSSQSASFFEQLIADTGFCHFSIYSIRSEQKTNWETTIEYKQRQRLGNHVYEGMPFEIMAFDRKFNKQVFKVLLGKPQAIKINTDFKPVFVCIDYDQKFSDAITEDVVITETKGNYSNGHSLLPISITEIKDSILLRIEHNWVYPDPYFNRLPGIVLSKERYWTIDGIFDSSLKAEATFMYDGNTPSNFSGGWLDNQLLASYKEDSLVLLYRPNAESDWQIESSGQHVIGSKLDLKGYFIVKELKKGQYTFGAYGKQKVGKSKHPQKKSGFKLYPNPGDNQIIVEWGTEVSPESYEIYNTQGQLVVAGEIAPGLNSKVIPTGDLLNGNYFISFYSDDKTRQSHEFIVSR